MSTPIFSAIKSKASCLFIFYLECSATKRFSNYQHAKRFNLDYRTDISGFLLAKINICHIDLIMIDTATK